MMAVQKAITEYRIKKLEEAIKGVHDRFDRHEEKQDEQFAKVYKSLNAIDNKLGKLQVEMEWTKKIAVAAGVVSGFVGGVLSFFTGIKPMA